MRLGQKKKIKELRPLKVYQYTIGELRVNTFTANYVCTDFD